MVIVTVALPVSATNAIVSLAGMMRGTGSVSAWSPNDDAPPHHPLWESLRLRLNTGWAEAG